jgi:chorismate dehydratase
MRIGAVNYLNSKPLVYGLAMLAPEARITYDLPSRLADSLATGRLDVALIPSVEFFRAPGHRIVSNACVACRGPVLSVKLNFRVPPNDVRRVALDEGSRTSAALTQILLAEMCGVRPHWEPLPIGCGPETTQADAVLLIGDRAISDFRFPISDSNPKSTIRNPHSEPVKAQDFVEVWDLGQKWCEWTGLPFVFAMWIARADADVSEMEAVLGVTRDQGVRHLREIAAREAPLVGISEEVAAKYLRDNLHFSIGAKERAGLRHFYDLCVAHKLAPSGLQDGIGKAGLARLHSP